MKSLLSTAIVTAAIGFLGWYGWRHAADLPELAWHSPGFWLNVTASLSLYILAILISSVNWRWLLAAFGNRPAPMIAESVFLMTQIGKYLPGNVGHFVGRVAVGRMRGISAGACSASMLCEQLLAISTAVLFISAGYLLIPADFAALERYLPGAPWLAALLLVAGLAPLAIGSLANHIGRWLPGRLRTALLELRNLGFAHVLRFVVVCGVVFLMLGLFVSRVAEAVAGIPLLTPAFAAIVFAAAWVAGLVTPGAPGGLGVRETIIVVGFAPVIGDGRALAIALVMRLVSILGDGITFLIGFAGDRLVQRHLREIR